MLEIRKWWPEITNEEIDYLNQYTAYEWLVIRRLITNGIGGGKEISEDDLIQSIPVDKIDKMKDAVKSLKKQKVIVKKPKPGIEILQVTPEKYTSTMKKFSSMIREKKDLSQALIDEDVKFLKVSDTLCLLIHKYCKSPYQIKPSLKITSNNESQIEELGVILTIDVNCPNSYRINKVTFEIISANEIFSKMETYVCKCGYEHTYTANGLTIC